MWIKQIIFFAQLIIVIFYFQDINRQEINSRNIQLEFIFYNTENLFDCENDSLSNDEEFVLNGLRKWNNYKLNDKIKKLSRAILASNNWRPPVMVGLCEVENRSVLSLLLEKSLLKNHNYAIIHQDSRDLRGIDVALIYDSLILQLVFQKQYRFDIQGRPTRDILYAKFGFRNDSFHVLVNHWPSRYSGTLQSEANRLIASKKLKSICDSIFSYNKMAKIFIMGDFNDNPNDKSLMNLCAPSETLDKQGLINLMTSCKKGTIKYHGIWNTFDQFIISKGVRDDLKSGFEVSASISDAKFLVEKDERYLGKKPFRTYSGYRYIGGYSDHLPIVLKLKSLK